MKKKTIVPFDDRRVDFSKFTPDVSLKDLRKMLGGTGVVYGAPIEILSPSKLSGLGTTNLMIYYPSMVDLNRTTPSVRLDLQSTGNTPNPPTLGILFDPFAYGITSAARYVFEFLIESTGPVTLEVGGSGVMNGGSKAVNGFTTLTVVLQDEQPTQPIWVYVEQTEGGLWAWYSTVVRFPPLVFES
jgi:hypothetical protein